MKSLIRLLSGIAASLLLAAGLHAAAGKLDPMTNDTNLQKLDSKTPAADENTSPPCYPCEIDQ